MAYKRQTPTAETSADGGGRVGRRVGPDIDAWRDIESDGWIRMSCSPNKLLFLLDFLFKISFFIGKGMQSSLV